VFGLLGRDDSLFVAHVRFSAQTELPVSHVRDLRRRIFPNMVTTKTSLPMMSVCLSLCRPRSMYVGLLAYNSGTGPGAIVSKF